MIKIIEPGDDQNPILTGRCLQCNCKVECNQSDTNLVFDRDSPNGARHIECPNCHQKFLWVNDGKSTSSGNFGSRSWDC